MPTRARVEREWSLLDAPHFPREHAADSALANIDGLLTEPLLLLTRNEGERCKSHDTTRAILASIQDKLAKISAHVTACESQGRFGVEQWLVGPKHAKPVVLSSSTLPTILQEYSAIHVAPHVPNRKHVKSHMPIYRGTLYCFRLRHFAKWIRDTGRSSANEREVRYELEHAGYVEKFWYIAVPEQPRTIQCAYWHDSNA